MGVVAISLKKNLSQVNQAHRVYPYLLRYINIDRSNQVCAIDITCLPTARGFVDLVAVIAKYGVP